MCTRIGIIDHGKLIAVGTLNELRRMVSADGQSLEQVFLQLTGSPDEDLASPLADLEP
jgi:ABC-2 type transport system ATP-binding protein